MRSGEIKALTGLRIVAALWVVFFHFRPLLRQAAPSASDRFAPVLDCGAQGVDLFFILSGFVLAWNYLDRLGPSFSVRATLDFLWLRLARVWPIYLVTLHLAMLWVIFTLHVGHVPAPEAGQLTAVSYVRQVLLVQLWFQPYFDGSSWDGPAWSISAEWLAYLVFGVLVLIIHRMAQVTSARGLMALAIAASLPPLLLLLVTGQFYTPWSWLPRIIMQFTAGALAGAAVRKLRLTLRVRRTAGVLSAILVTVTVAALYYFDAHPLSGVYDSGGLVDVLFVPLVMALAAGSGALPTLLSTRLLVYGGKISFCLYMVHELVHTTWNWVAEQFQIVLEGTAAKWLLAGLLAAAIASSMLLFHTVEEPGRRWMRRMAAVSGAQNVRRPNESASGPTVSALDPGDQMLDPHRSRIPVSAR